MQNAKVDADDANAEDASRETLQTYERHAAQYAERTSWARSPLVDDLVALTNPGHRILELGTGPGRDAKDLEEAGLVVDRTDGAASFVGILIADGHRARVLDFYADDFGGPYDAVFANAVLLHVHRERLQGVLAVARRATTRGGVLVASFKKGPSEGWSTQKLDGRRFFTYWLEDELAAVIRNSGWSDISVTETTSRTSPERWITTIAHNRPAR